MRAIIVISGNTIKNSGEHEEMPVELLPVIDRPLIQRLVEHLVDHKFREFDFILGDFTEIFEQTLGDGTRWGSTFRYHLCKNLKNSFFTIKKIVSENEKRPIFYLRGNCLPFLDNAILPNHKYQTYPIFYKTSKWVGSKDNSGWAGCSWLSPEFIQRAPAGLENEHFEEFLKGYIHRNGCVAEIQYVISVQSPADLVKASQFLLENSHLVPTISGREIESNVFVGRNARIHPTAKIISPAWVGENCIIGKSATLGPNASICHNSIIGNDTVVENSVVMKNTFLGEGLEARDLLVHKNHIFNFKLNVGVQIEDEFIASDMNGSNKRPFFQRCFSYGFALFFLVAFFPIWFTRGIGLKWRQIQRKILSNFSPGSNFQKDSKKETSVNISPTSHEHKRAKTETKYKSYLICHFLDEFLPSLWKVLRGEIHLVGLPQRNPEEINALSPTRRALYIQGHIGLIHEGLIYFGPSPTQDENYAAEAFYMAKQSMRHDLKLLGSYFGRVVKSLI
jgi:NDP-sugar pyrophosphorylase family protein